MANQALLRFELGRKLLIEGVDGVRNYVVAMLYTWSKKVVGHTSKKDFSKGAASSAAATSGVCAIIKGRPLKRTGLSAGC